MPETSPWGPLIGFAVIVFGLIFAGRALPRMGQGAMIGFAFALAAGIGVFAFSAFFYPEAFIAQIIIIGAALFAALSLFEYKTKRVLWDISKYALGAAIGGIVYFSVSGFVPTLKLDPIPKTAQIHQSHFQNTKRPVFASSTGNISEQARMRAQKQMTEMPAKNKPATNEE